MGERVLPRSTLGARAWSFGTSSLLSPPSAFPLDLVVSIVWSRATDARAPRRTTWAVGAGRGGGAGARARGVRAPAAFAAGRVPPPRTQTSKRRTQRSPTHGGLQRVRLRDGRRQPANRSRGRRCSAAVATATATTAASCSSGACCSAAAAAAAAAKQRPPHGAGRRDRGPLSGLDRAAGRRRVPTRDRTTTRCK